MSPINPTPTRRKYDEDFKTEVLPMLESGQSVAAVSQSLGIGENLIYRWKSKQKASLLQQAKQEPSEFSLKVLQENEALKQGVKQLEMQGEILKKPCLPRRRHFQSLDLRASYELIAWQLLIRCKYFVSGYYRFIQGLTYQPSLVKEDQLGAVKGVFNEHKRTYGSRRTLAELQQAETRQIGRHRVGALMPEAGLRAKQPRSFVPKTTDSSHKHRACPNLLLDEQGKFIGLPMVANRIWVSDITYIRLVSGEFIYLGTWLERSAAAVVFKRCPPGNDCRLASRSDQGRKLVD